jgi:hypothetical protein
MDLEIKGGRPLELSAEQGDEADGSFS